MKIKQVIIEGFRAYQSKADGTFDFTTSLGDCANFVSIYAPNGFGKTSFYDAVEWNLTNHVGRFVREQTRAQNDATSRSQNQEDRKQYILRNRFIADGAPSQVTVVADTFKNIKPVPPARRGSRDYLFEKDNKALMLSDIFLSQEAIDAFLREEKPETRYTKFMESFGDEDEIYRKNLTALRRELKISLTKSKEEEAKHRIKAEIPINPAILEEINKTIVVLQKESEEIAGLRGDFDAENIRLLQNLITKRSHELEIASKDAQSAISELDTESSRLNEISAAKDSKVKAQSDIASLSETRDIFEQREKLLASIAGLSKFINDVAAEIVRLNAISDQIPEFLEKETKSATTNALLRRLQNDLILNQSEISSFENRAVECRQLLTEVESTTNKLRTLQQEAEAIFQQLDASIELKEISESNAAGENIRAQLLTTKIRNHREELKKAEAIDVSEATINSADVSVLGREGFSLVPLRAASLEKQTKQIALDAANNALNQAESQVSQFSTLIALGTELATKLHSKECPLCSHHHDSHIALIDRILKNPLLTAYGAEAVRSRNAAQHEFELAAEKLTSLLDDWRIARSKVILAISETISSDEINLRSALATAKKLELQISDIDENIKKLRSRVLDRSKDQLADHINTQLTLLSARRQKELDDLDNCNGEIEKRQQRAKAESQVIEKFRVEQKLIAEDDGYQNVKAFSATKSISSSELSGFVGVVRIDLERELLDARTKLNESTNKLATIEKEYPTLPQLTRQILDDIEMRGRASIAGADATLMRFASSVRRRIPEYEEVWSVADITANIAAFIALTRDRVSDLAFLSEAYSLLGEQLNDALPFMESISAKKELNRVLLENLRQEALLSELEREYAGTIERLQQRVRGFFYTDLINAIYRKIDPHPDFKQVLFDCEFSETDRPRLHVLVADDKGDVIAPSLYFSAAQVNILSLSIFLARALHVKQDDGSEVKCIFIDDPIHSMDSINVLSTIDLLRSISSNFDRQIILSTHDRNFFDLLKKKIPEQQYASKFIELETFGRVKQPQDQQNMVEF